MRFSAYNRRVLDATPVIPAPLFTCFQDATGFSEWEFLMVPLKTVQSKETSPREQYPSSRNLSVAQHLQKTPTKTRVKLENTRKRSRVPPGGQNGALRGDGSMLFFQPRSILTTPDCRTQSRSSPKSRSPFWGGGANPRSHPRRQRNRGITSYNVVHPQTGFMRFAWKATRLT